jgi:hypothetical protein
MKRLAFVFSLLALCLGAERASADEALECRNMWAMQHADVDGPVTTVTDNGAGHGLDLHYRIIVRDHFTGCRIADTTDTVCRIGQHAAIVGGSFGDWLGNEKNTDTDYTYIGHHQWTCE